jgi:hypothetical protein
MTVLPGESHRSLFLVVAADRCAPSQVRSSPIPNLFALGALDSSRARLQELHAVGEVGARVHVGRP